MATDTMDIDMDIDVGPVDDMEVPEIDLNPDLTSNAPPDTATEIDTNQPVLHKVHVRGLDNLSTDHLKKYIADHGAEGYKKLEWIDDTSANFVYEDAGAALEVLRKLAAADLPADSQLPYQIVPSKPLSTHPDVQLHVRLAVVGDQKKAGARERSRFYLFNPQYDHVEQRKKDEQDMQSRRRYRDRDDNYRTRRYDDREQRRREADAEFDANMYDDDEAAVASRPPRVQRRRRWSDSPSEPDLRDGDDGRRARRQPRELFPEFARRDVNRLRKRSRSRSPGRDRDGDESMGESKYDERSIENRASAQKLKRETFGENIGIELFPAKTKPGTHHRSDAFDAAAETADLFAHKMVVPIVDGSGDDELKIRGSRRLEDRITAPRSSTSLNIRGAAGDQDFSIKGAANSVKELFPGKFGSNSGKELFSDKLEGRGGRRKKAEDLFS